MTRSAHIVLTILVLLLVIHTSTFPQKEKLQIERLTMEDGLSESAIFGIVQDHMGFLWIGTQSGLNRYDGYIFKKYYSDLEDSTSICHNFINCIYEDKLGNLWIGTAGGLNKYNRKTDSFIRFKSKPNNPGSLSSNVVMSIYEDTKGILWIGTDGGGLNMYERSSGKFLHFKHNPDDSSSLSNNRIFNAICEDAEGNLLVGTLGGGLNLLNRQTNTFKSFTNNPINPNSISSDRIYTIYSDNFGTIWIGTEGGGLNRMVTDGKGLDYPKFLSYHHNPSDVNSISGNRVYSISEDTDGNFWVGNYDGGLDYFNKSSNQFVRYDIPRALSIYQDRSNIIWIGTFGDCLYKLNKNKQLFRLYRNDPNHDKSLSNGIVWSFLEYKENIIWIGTMDGLNILNRKSNEFLHFRNQINNPTSLSDNTVYKIFKDRRNDLWIGTNNGLNRAVLGDKDAYPVSFIRYMHNDTDPSGICGHLITTLYEDVFGRLWIGTEDGGISTLRRGSNGYFSEKFSNYKHNPNDSTSLCTNRVYIINGTSDDDLWIGTNNGLDLYNRNHDNFIHFKHNPNDITSLSDNWVNAIYEDAAGTLWIGTYMGLNRFDKNKGGFKRYTTKNGLPTDVILDIVEDNNGNLWISTNNGLSKFNPLAETFFNYDVNDGLQGNEFAQYAGLKTSSGELFFGGENGFNVFHPDSLIGANTNIPKIVITNFLLNNRKVEIGFDSTLNRKILESTIETTREIELYYYDQVMSFEFSALEFTAPEKNQYAYMMEGFDEDWNYTDAGRRFVTYTNLDPGKYIFKVKGSNNEGIWNEAGVSLRITILPPWWATTWSYLVYALIILSIIYFTWKLQVKRIRIKHSYEMSKFEADKMHEVDEMKSRFFANISHEFRTPLTLIFGPANDVIEETNEPQTKKKVSIIRRNAGRLYGLVNQLLDLSKLEAGKMKLETSEQDIIPLLKGIFLSFTSFAERKKVILKFNTNQENLNVYIDKDKMEKIINNLLSNAFKFTPERGKIDFTVEKLISDVEIRITDNGIGIPEERIDNIFDRFYQVDSSNTRQGEGTGIGLALTKELVELHKGKIKVESKEGEGTTFTVQLPLGKDHLNPGETVEKEFEEIVPEDEELPEPVPDIENRKEKTETDILLDNDKPLLLIVEDNTDVRSYITSHFDEDYRILEAVDGEDGLNQAVKHIPDLIISDVMMPKMDGFELCNKIKTDEKTSHIPVIMLTAKATSKDKIEGYETGADDYIMKPFDAKELKARIKNLIEIRKKLQEKFSSDGISIPKGLSSIDEQFMKRILCVINDHISEEEFNIEELGKEAAMSRFQIYKKIKALTGKSPSLFLRSLRLVKAKKMIKENKGTIAEIAYSVGFSSPSYFSKCFSEEFGYPPSEG